MKKFLLLACLFCWALPISAAEQTLYFFNWSEYLPEQVLEQFTEETGIKVVYTTYDSNEAMYAKLKLLEGGGYDLAVPSTYYVNKMRREQLLLPIDKQQLGNYRNLDPQLLNRPFDPDNAYSIPYLWGSTGLGVDSAVVDPSRLQSWSDLWNPDFKGQVLLTNDVREVFGMALLALGYSGNSTDEVEIKAAYEKLTGLMPNVRVFNSDSPKLPFLAGEVSVGMLWNGEAFLARQENPEIRYIYPREGAMLWMDNLVIPKGARNAAAAHQLIDFLLRPEVARLISEEIGYATPNAAALELMDEEVRSDPTVYPAAADLEKAEFQLDIGEAIVVYEKYWEMLKAGR